MTDLEIIPGVFQSDMGYITLDVTDRITVRGGELTLDGQRWLAKQEFHCTLFHFSELAKLLGESDTRVLEVIHSILDDQPITADDFTPEQDYRFLAKPDGRRSIVQMVSSGLFDKIFDSVNLQVGVDLPVQPTHVTLFTLDDGRGIGIDSFDELAQLGRPATAEESRQISQAIELNLGGKNG